MDEFYMVFVEGCATPTNMRIWKAPKMKRKDLLLFLRRKHTFYVQ